MNKRNIAIFTGVIILILSIVGSYFFFFKQKEEVKTDAILFKEEYESLNGSSTSNQKTHRSITIEEENPFIYQTAEEIVKRIENKETFAVYFGFKSCPWCRSMLPTLINVAKDLNLTKIYYVDVSDIRDIKEIQDNKIVTKKEGSEGYQKLLSLLDEVLEEYILKDKEREIDTKEKRIYAPNVVSILQGKPDSLTTGISKKQTDAYMEITDEMKSEMYNQLKCTLECIKENQAICTKPSAC